MIPIRVEWVGVEPMPAPRPRSSSHGSGVYMPTEYTAYRDALAWMMIAARRKAEHQAIFRAPVGLVVQFARSTRRKVDLDNLLKTVMDAGNGGVLWADDSLIHNLRAMLVLGADLPGTLIEAYELEPDVAGTALYGAPSDASRRLEAIAPDSTPEGLEVRTSQKTEGVEDA